MGISFGTLKASDAFKYSPRLNLSQFKSASAIHCSQKQRRTAKGLWAVTDEIQWRILASWADGRAAPGARLCRGGCPVTTGTTLQLDWGLCILQLCSTDSATRGFWCSLAGPTLSEILHYTGCPNPSLSQISGSWLCKYNHCNSAAQEWNMYFRDRILQVAMKSGTV